MTLSPIRKVYRGIPNRRQMFRLFDRHEQQPNRSEHDAGVLYTGEWFEVAVDDHQHMFDILPPLWMEWDMFALREFLAAIRLPESSFRATAGTDIVIDVPVLP